MPQAGDEGEGASVPASQHWGEDQIHCCERGWGNRPGKGQELWEEDNFEGTAPNTLGSGGRGADRCVVPRDSPTVASAPQEGPRTAAEGQSTAQQPRSPLAAAPRPRGSILAGERAPAPLK